MGLTAKTRFLAPMMLVALLLAGCQTTPEPRSDLYQQLGERTGIALIVEDLLYLIIDDTRINHQFKGIDVAKFHQQLTDQLCELSGGPCTYTGRNMREAHQDMGVTDTQFNALAEDLILAMEKNRVPTGAQNRLLKLLVPMYPDIRNL